MGDLENIIYVILIVIYIASRLFRGEKKDQTQPAPEKASPPPPQKEESIFDTIREEIKRQQELARQRELQEKQKEVSQQKPVISKKVKKTIKAAPLKYERIPEEGENMIDTITGEGVSAFTRKTASAAEEKTDEPGAFEFDPREAFMMKTLLERHPMV